MAASESLALLRALSKLAEDAAVRDAARDVRDAARDVRDAARDTRDAARDTSDAARDARDDARDLVFSQIAAQSKTALRLLRALSGTGRSPVSITKPAEVGDRVLCALAEVGAIEVPAGAVGPAPRSRRGASL